MSSAVSSLTSLLNTLRNEKRAFGGTDSSHPSAKADDGTVDPKEGPRGDEHKKDLKDVPGPDNVITAPEAKPDEQNALQMNMGLQSKAVGTDPANERNYGTKPEDPGTTHPANAEKNAFDRAATKFTESSNSLLAKLAAAATTGAAPAAVTVTPPEQKAAAAGYAAAADAIDAGVPDGELVKFAAAYAADFVLAADLTAAYLTKLAEEAEGGEGGGEKKEEPAEKKEAPAGGEGGGEGGGSPAPPADLVGQMKGDAAAGGGDDIQELASAIAEMGMSPQDVIALLHAVVGGGMGGPPGGGMGGPPGGGMGGPPGGGMGGPPAGDPGLDALAGGGPGADPMAGLDPTKMAAAHKARLLLDLTQQVKAAALSGNLRVTAAATTAQTERRNAVKQAIRDLINPRRQ